jgi:predicted branched-subunit amino acid permease
LTPQPARRALIRDAVAIGLATGAYGLSFGAVAATAGLSVAQTSALSALMFTGASQFAFVAALGSGGAWTGAATAALLGTRNAFYGLRLSPILPPGRGGRLVGAQLVIDESTAMAVSRDDPEEARVAFWATGIAVFVCWNAATLIGAVAARALSDPRTLGLDAAAPAAFVALLAPRLRTRTAAALAAACAAVALAATPFTPNGIPVLAAAVVVLVTAARTTPALPEERT